MKQRIRSIDILRGLVMVIMALDHVRDFFHTDALVSNPLDPAGTTPILYFTRWITHLCAPIFVFLSGTSIYLAGMRKTRRQQSAFLFKRGLWLILIELVVMSFGFTFDPGFSFIVLQVIWAIGISMVILALLVWLPLPVIFFIGILICFGHNLLDIGEAQRQGQVGVLWSILHRPAFYQLGSGRTFGILYPFLPWTGIMIMGYCLGKWYEPAVEASARRRRLALTGLALIIFFMALRAMNSYGDPSPWAKGATDLRTFFSFMNVQKYPPSLLFSSITLGIGLLLLAWFESVRGAAANVLNTYGRVPLFYFIVHFYLIHFACMILFFVEGYGPESIRSPNSLFLFRPVEFGYPLWVVYLMWAALVALLYPLCKWYDRYKSAHTHWWLSYL